jgi:single-stranded-DNA-specific exonuclease
VSHGGHAAAAGLKIDEANLDRFRAEFCEHAAVEISADTRLPELAIDAEVPLSALTIQTVRQIEQLSPFGQGNPRPVMCTTDVTLAEPPKTIGGGDRHLAMRLSQHGVTLRAVCFGGGERKDELANLSGPLEVAYRPVINSFRGYQNVELQVVDWRPQGEGH